MVRGRAILAGVLAAPWIRVAHGQVAHRISLIHFNDFHSRHEAVDSKQLTCATRSCTRLDSGTRQRNQAAGPRQLPTAFCAIGGWRLCRAA